LIYIWEKLDIVYLIDNKLDLYCNYSGTLLI